MSVARAYYNEIDPYAADWLETLILLDLIAPGDVDRRSIEDVTPNDLRGYTQCHFFAGIGGWSLALRLAGWPDDRPVWTGSCPCQPFSAAGKGKGAADERHLWPAWFHLVQECRPHVIFGEQVEAAVKHDWLDLVHADLEGIGYAVGATCIPAAGVGAPHGRSRLWFVADDDDDGQRRQIERRDGLPNGESQRRSDVDGRSAARVVGHADERRGGRDAGALPGTQGGVAGSVRRVADGAEPASDARRLADGGGGGARLEGHVGHGDDRDGSRRVGADAAGSVAASGGACGVADTERCLVDGRADVAEQGSEGRNADRRDGQGDAADPTHGFWRSADWLLCRDGKFRPVEPGTFPLAHGIPARVGRLRAYGNAIVPQAAAEVIGAYMELGR